MSISVPTVEDLKALPSSARLRFVEEKISFYWRNPTSISVADNDKIVTSNAGGRWIKQNSASTAGEIILWQSVTGNVAASSNTGYSFNLTTGDALVTLPSSPPLNTPVGISKINPTNYGTNRVLINRNGTAIEGEAVDRQIVFQGQTVIFRFLGGDIGWSIESQKPVFRHGGTVQSFAAPSSLDTPQRGIIDFAGRGFVSGAAWSNPFLSGNIRVSRYSDATGSSPQFAFDQALTGTTLATTLSLGSETYTNSSSSSAGIERGFLHIGFRSASGRINQVRLGSIYWHGYVLNTGAFRNLPARLDVYGSNDPDITSKLNYGGLQNSGERRYNIFNVLNQIDSKAIASVDLTNQADWVTSATGVAYRHRYIPINSSEFFTDFILVSNRGDVASGIGTVDPPIQLLNELEMYGSIQSIYVP